MLWILLVVGGFGASIMFFVIVVELFSSWCDWYDVKDYAFRMLGFLVIGALGLSGLDVIDSMSYEEVSQTGDWKLQSLSDSSQISGKGAGGLFYVYIDTNEVSFYYQVNDDAKRGKVDADRATIYERDCTPHVVEYTTYTKNKMNSRLRILLAFGYGEDSEKNYEIYTPKGTILNLDSQ